MAAGRALGGSAYRRLVCIAFALMCLSYAQASTENVFLDAIASTERTRYGTECLDIPFSVCVGDGRKLLAADNIPKNLIGWWSFDDAYGHDWSGHGNHAYPPPNVGPAYGGRGQSGWFNGSNMVQIPHSSIFQTKEFSISFWMYLLRDSIGGWRTILQKGTSVQEMTPSILLWPKERRLHVRVSTDYYWNEGLDSKAIIPLHRWSHISVVSSGALLQLYVNGILDTQIILKGTAQFNLGPLHLGKDPWHPGTAAFIDDLRLYDKVLKDREIEAMAAPALGGIGAKFVRLGCESCPFAQAIQSCPDDYHLCSLKELNAGGYHVARVMGWFHLNSAVWSRNIAERADQLADENRLALCCADD